MSGSKPLLEEVMPQPDINSGRGSPSGLAESSNMSTSDLMKEPLCSVLSGPSIVVKVASQCVPDMTVDCEHHWTVHNLKEHLCQHHLLHPSVKEQRLIYSGHLLSDECSLISELRHTPPEARFVVHLVCAATQHQNTSAAPDVPTNSTDNLSSRPPAALDPPTSAHVTTNTDGLRHRAAGEINTPDATAAMQQIYAQYLTSYMSYLQMGGGGVTMTGGTWSPHQQHLVNFQHPAADTAQPPQPAANPAAAEPPQQDNEDDLIAVGEVGGILENEGGNERRRPADWLDTVYSASRLMLLIFFIYGYTPVHRFMIVITVCVLAYLYRLGWFRSGRAQQPDNIDQQPQQQQGDEEQLLQQMDDRNNNIANNNNNIIEEPVQQQQQEQQVEEVIPQIAEQQPSPSLLMLSWTFLTTFFTSLIPEQPQLL